MRAIGERGEGTSHPRESLVPTRLLVRPVRTGVRGPSDGLRVLGGRGAAEEEEDLPELSDSGDEAAWEDEDEAGLPRDRQHTPCLFCDRFVHLSATLQSWGARAAWVCVVRSCGAEPEGLVEKGDPQRFRGRSHRLKARSSSTGLSVPFCKIIGFWTGSCGTQIWFYTSVP